MTKKVFNLIVLDESGSMNSIRNATVSGVNETIQSIKNALKNHQDQEHYLSLISFNSEAIHCHYDCVPVSDINIFDGKNYEPDSCTPLYDAIGSSISKLRRQVLEEDLVLVTIITDGLENDSHEYDYKAITSLMDSMKSRGWMITYIGANQDAIKTARALHIDDGLDYDATPEGVKKMMLEERKAREAYYKCIEEQDTPKNVMSKISGNFFKRKKKN